MENNQIKEIETLGLMVDVALSLAVASMGRQYSKEEIVPFFTALEEKLFTHYESEEAKNTMTAIKASVIAFSEEWGKEKEAEAEKK